MTILAIGVLAGAGIAVGILWADRWIARTVADMDWGVDDADCDTEG